MEIPIGVPYRTERHRFRSAHGKAWLWCRRLLAAAALSLAAVLPLFPQSESDNRNLTELFEKAGTSGFFEEFVEVYSSEENPKEALRIMQKFLPVLEEDAHRHRLLLDMAGLEEQIGRLDQAQLHYQSAAFAAPGRRDYRALYNSVLLLIDQGDFSQALLQIRQILEKSTDPGLLMRARVQEARIYQLQDRTAEAEEAAGSLVAEKENLPSDVLYNLWLFYRNTADPAQSDNKKAEELQRLLGEKFPDSPEYRMSLGEVGEFPTVETSMGLRVPGAEVPFEETTPEIPVEREGKREGKNENIQEVEIDEKKNKKPSVPELEKSRAIQTGSFRDAENAAYMRRELEREGFTAMVVQANVGGRLYYRVLVPVAFGESEQEVLLKLKEKGFEGNPVY